MKKLEIGSGSTPTPGYEHLEINRDYPHIEYNCSCEQLPMDDNTYDEIIACHVIEHIEWQKTRAILKEWCRVLKPGGVLVVATPNLAYVIKAYLDASDEEWRKELTTEGWSFPEECYSNKTAWLNFKIFSTDIPFNLHKACFDEQWMNAMLIDAGFEKISFSPDPRSLHFRAFKRRNI